MDIELSKSLGPVKLALMDTADKANKRRMTINGIRCKRNCAGCCSRYIRISVAEAVIIYEHLRLSNKWFEVKLRAQRQFETAQITDPLSWFKLNIPCPVLSPDKLCLAYNVRPALCSTHFVTSHPRLCDPWGSGLGAFKSVDLDDLYGKFKAKISTTTIGHRVLSIELIMSSALLLAERISVQSGLDLKEALSLIFRQL